MKRFLVVIFLIAIFGAVLVNGFGKKEPDFPSLQYVIFKSYDGHSLKRERILAENPYYTRYYITYQSDEFKISGIMNVPKGEGPFPVIILNHGYIPTSVYTNGRGLKREQDYLAKNGYVVLHPDYRNHAGSDDDPENEVNMRIGYLEDVINAVYAVKNSSYDFVDKKNIGMLGHSLGGGIALNVMVTKPRIVQAYVLFAPIHADYRYNYDKWIRKKSPDLAKRIEHKFGAPDKLRSMFMSPEENPEFWDNISAINFLANITDPLMIHHGTADQTVPIEWSDELEKKLYESDKDFYYYTYENEPHEFIKSWPLVMERTLEFFDNYLQ